MPRLPFTSSESVVPRDAERGGGDGQAQRLNALTQHKAAGVGWVPHGHESISLSVVLHHPRHEGHDGWPIHLR